MTHVMHNFASPRRPRHTGFTLIEIMVVVGILVLLTTILLAVTTSVSRKAEISRTKMVLKGLDAIRQDYESATGQPLLMGADNIHPIGTVYAINSGGDPRTSTPIAATASTGLAPNLTDPAGAPYRYNYVNLLMRVPQTRDELEKLINNAGGGSEKLVDVNNSGYYVILDAWGNPIDYIRAEWVPGSNLPAGATSGFAGGLLPSHRSFFMSSGPDGETDFRNNVACNADDIRSYDP